MFQVNRKRNKDTGCDPQQSSKKSKTTSNKFNADGRCLRQIFKYLSFNDELAVNASKMRKHLVDITGKIFVGKYTNAHFIFSNPLDEIAEQFFDPDGSLKNIGNTLKKLVVVYMSDYHSNIKLFEDAITKYCSKSLVEIVFDNPNAYTMYGNKNSFPKVKKVEFDGGEICYQLSNFDQWFPKAHTLTLRNQESGEAGSGGDWCRNYSKLKIFKIYQNGNSAFQIQMEQVQAFIDSNQQLKRFKIATHHINIDAGFVDFIGEKLPELKSLELWYDKDILSHAVAVPVQIKFQMLKKLALGGGRLSILDDILAENIDEIHLSTYVLDESCVNFLSNHRNLKIIKFSGFWENVETFKAFVDLMPKMPNLIELKFPYPQPIDVNEIDCLLEKCKSLKKLISVVKNVKKSQRTDLEQEIFLSIPCNWNFCIKKRSKSSVYFRFEDIRQ